MDVSSFYFYSVWVLQQMPLHQLLAQHRQRIEHRQRAGDGDARKVGAQESCVAMTL